MLCETFKDQASRISTDLTRARHTGLGIQEESLTESLLLRIQFECGENFLTKKFTRKEEGSITGADWLWCIGEPGRWSTFAIQAKITSLATGRVNYLHYRNGEQYNLLINFCKQFRFIPKYSIFSNLGEEMSFFSKGLDELKNISLEQWSLSIISPKHIKHLSRPDEKHISKVLDFSIPWSYVVCGQAHNALPLADKIAHNLEKIYWIFENKFRNKRNMRPSHQSKQIDWENPRPSQLITKNIPLPVVYILTKQRFSHKVPIANVSLFSTVPTEPLLEGELRRIERTRQWKVYPRTFEHAILRIQDRRTIYLLPPETHHIAQDRDNINFFT